MSQVVDASLQEKCLICNNLSPDIGESENFFSVGDWLSSTLPSDLTGDKCSRCAFLVQVLDAYYGDSWRSEEVRLYIQNQWPVMIEILDDSSFLAHGSKKCIELSRDVDNNIPAWSRTPHIGGGARLLRDANGHEVWNFISNCLSECTTNHSSCPGPEPTPLPTRLLEIDNPGQLCRLVETRPGQKGRYTALSYCWGSQRPLCTTLGTYQLLKDGIPWAQTPRLFQDVVEISHRLGVRYVWIDSLCIVQDDPKDWDIETERMAEVYNNTYVTIVASASADSQASMFPERPPPEEAMTFEFSEEDGSTSYLFSRLVAAEDNLYPVDINEVFSRSWQDRIYTRGWTLQEDVLSARAIHYLPRRVVWECRTRHCDERGLPRCQSEQQVHPCTEKKLTPCRNEFRSRQLTMQKTGWRNCVIAFTIRHLTYISDKLPAMSGIAKVVSDTTDDEYLAGLWRESLVIDMSWEKINYASGFYPEVDGPSSTTTALTVAYRAPSWSWASLENGSAVVPQQYEHVEVQIASLIDAGVTLKGQNRFGEVTSGFAKLRGPLLEIQLEYLAEGDEWIMSFDPPDASSDALIEFNPDTALGVKEGLLETGEMTPTMCRNFHIEHHEGPFPKACLILMVATSENVVGLALGRSATVPGAYERLGRILLHARYLEIIRPYGVETTITIL